MDRRERYDPEDIESLMSERAFDELLPEERAFVLRHLSGREEYGAMRALLQQVRTLKGEDEPLVPDPDVRERVLHTFRTHHQRRPGFSLNTVFAWLLPPSSSTPWLRPALALAGVALLVGMAFFLVDRAGVGRGAALAEVKGVEERTEGTPASEGSTTSGTKEEASVEPGSVAHERPALPEVMEIVEDDALAEGASPEEDHAGLRSRADLDDAEQQTRQVTTGNAAAMEPTTVVTGEHMAEEREPARRMHTVTADELMTNQSLTNASGKVRADVTRKPDVPVGRALSQDAALLALLVKGW